MYISNTIKVGGGYVLGLLKEEDSITNEVYEKVVELDFDKKRLNKENLQTKNMRHLSGKVVDFS